MEFYDMKSITLQNMIDYIEENKPEDKKAFKKAAFTTKDGKATKKYNHLHAVRWFCEQYFPDLIPVKKEKAPNKSDVLKGW